ncbi:MAG: hypothetical protein JXA42_04690, partial [Anaerolineales bacterium]|nr:hypothetical protein [Anaerolineales bacterium]
PPQIEKIKRADVIIDTGKQLEDTKLQVENAWRLLQPAGGKTSPSMDGVSIRRGAPRDAAALADFFNRSDANKPPMSRPQMLASFGDQGYMLAINDGAIVATASWNTENFIACIYKVLVDPHDLSIGQAVLESVCQAATELMCEVALLFYRPDTPVHSRDLYLSSGFESVALDDLISAWKKAARASMPAGSLIMVRKLRESRVMRPI